MSNFESKLFQLNSKLLNNVHTWLRYVDDIFCIWTGSDRQLDNFTNLLNNMEKNIRFTVEKELNGTLNFLDLSITRKNPKLEFKIYRKPTTTDTVIPALSNQSEHIKHAVFHSLIFRLINVPLSKSNFQDELNIIKQIAVNNGYEPELIDNILKRKLRKRTESLLYNSNTNNHNNHVYCSLNFTNKTSIKIKNRLKKFGITAIVANKKSLGYFIKNNKQKMKCKLENSGIYQINCSNCNAFYLGQSGRAIKKRVREHKHSINHKINSTGLAEHCNTHKHTFDENNVKILHVQNKSKKLNLLESLEIKKALHNKLNIVNSQVELTTGNTPLLIATL